jgi:hypothetical protein
MHDVVAAAGKQIRLTRWPEDFVIEPDPPAPGTTMGRRRYTGGRCVDRKNPHAFFATMKRDDTPQLSPVLVGVDSQDRLVLSTRETQSRP